MNISSLNLNLLLAFEALLEERNVSRAAARIGISQPAMSNALAKLRENFGDQLLIRTGRGMAPTPRALELIGPVRIGLTQLRNAISERPTFNPSLCTHGFQVAMSDYTEMLLLGRLLKRLRRIAPDVQIYVKGLDRVFIPPESDLRAGRIDMAIGFFPEATSLAPDIYSIDLSVEDNVCIVRKGNQLTRKHMTLRQFSGAGHLGIFFPSDTQGMIDNIMAGHGLRRRLQATTPHFLSAPTIVAESDLIAVVPERLATLFSKKLPLEIHKLPVALPPLRTRLLWHEHTNEDPAHLWLRSLISHCLGKASTKVN